MFWIIFSLVVAQRLIEVGIAKRHEQLMLAKGAYEVGASHYPYMVALHVCFFISLLIEVQLFERLPSPYFIVLCILFALLQICRIWCLRSLGEFWNTKIIILPEAHVVAKGPYKWMRHPNYLIVTLEIVLLPLIFSAYGTAFVFTLLNCLMLAVRIPIEEKALRTATNYSQQFRD